MSTETISARSDSGAPAPTPARDRDRSLIDACDVCGSRESAALYSVPGYRTPKAFTVVRCGSCGLVFAPVTEEDLRDAYEKDYYTTVYQNYEADLPIFDRNNHRVLRRIERHVRPGNLVEIGSAFGSLLRVAKARGWKSQVGFETSRYASAVAREKYGLDVRHRDFLQNEIADPVDAVVLLDAVEHLVSPSRYLAKASAMLRPGGIVYLSTGDLASPYARFFGSRWRLMTPPLHIYFYTPDSLSRLLHKHGFEILAVEHPFKLQNLGSVLQYLTGLSRSRLPMVPVPLNVGDVMSVVARKR